MKAYQDKKTKLWNYGRGTPYKYKTKKEAEDLGMKEFTEALKELKRLYQWESLNILKSF